MYRIVITTVPNKKIANSIAHRIINKNLAACINIISDVTSIYRWKNSIEKTTEFILLIKSTSYCYDELVSEINVLHPYEIPEIISIPIHDGYSLYLNWILSQTKNK